MKNSIESHPIRITRADFFRRVAQDAGKECRIVGLATTAIAGLVGASDIGGHAFDGMILEQGNIFAQVEIDKQFPVMEERHGGALATGVSIASIGIILENLANVGRRTKTVSEKREEK